MGILWNYSSHDGLNRISQRGEHDIESYFQYPTAHGFIFHDSRGFEAGSADELNIVKSFIEERSRKEKLKDCLHAIWCVTASKYSDILRTLIVTQVLSPDQQRQSDDKGGDEFV